MEKNEYLSYFPSAFPFAGITGSLIVLFVTGALNPEEYCSESVWAWRNEEPEPEAGDD